MTGIYWAEGEASIQTFSSSTKKNAKGIETIVKIEIKINDHRALGYLLGQLDEMTATAKVKTPSAKTKPSKEPRLALPAPLLQIPHFGDGK